MPRRPACVIAVFVLTAELLYAGEGEAPGLDPALSQEEINEGFTSLFDGKSLNGWQGVLGNTNSYYVENGALIAKAITEQQGHIFTQREFADFSLRLDIKIEPGGNNGVGIRTQVTKVPHLEGMEIQVLDEPEHSHLLEDLP